MRAGITQSMDWDTRPEVVGVAEVLYAAILLVLTRFALLALGFQRTAAIVNRLSRAGGSGTAVDVDPAQVRASTYAVSLAAAFVPARILCLERSLVLYHKLRRDGVPAALRMGVRAYPFEAHAWVELEGSPLDEVPDHLKDFAPIFELGA